MKRLAPVFTLALLSPFIAEILFGATPLSRVASFPPLILLYGGGAVLIRETAHRTRGGWAAILCLGAAYALLEEGLVMQTLFSPDLFGAAACGGRFGGVNWVWTEALIGYHAVWSVLVPIILTELCFRNRRKQAWLGRAGLIVAGVAYLLGAASISIVFRRFLTPGFRAPEILLAATALFVLGLVTWALMRRPTAARPTLSHAGGAAPSAWAVALAALSASALWMQLLILPQFLRRGALVLLPMAVAVWLALGVGVFFGRWSRPNAGWTDSHRLAAIAGAVTASSAFGAHVIQNGTALDRAGQAACSFASLVLLWTLWGKVSPQPIPNPERPESAGISVRPSV